MRTKSSCVARARFRNLMETDEGDCLPQAVVESAAKCVKTRSVSCYLLYYALVLARFRMDDLFELSTRSDSRTEQQNQKFERYKLDTIILPVVTLDKLFPVRNLVVISLRTDNKSQNANRGRSPLKRQRRNLHRELVYSVRRRDSFKTNRKCNPCRLRLCTALTTCLEPAADRPSFDCLYDCSLSLSDRILRPSRRCGSSVPDLHEPEIKLSVLNPYSTYENDLPSPFAPSSCSSTYLHVHAAIAFARLQKERHLLEYPIFTYSRSFEALGN